MENNDSKEDAFQSRSIGNEPHHSTGWSTKSNSSNLGLLFILLLVISYFGYSIFLNVFTPPSVHTSPNGLVGVCIIAGAFGALIMMAALAKGVTAPLPQTSSNLTVGKLTRTFKLIFLPPQIVFMPAYACDAYMSLGGRDIFGFICDVVFLTITTFLCLQTACGTKKKMLIISMGLSIVMLLFCLSEFFFAKQNLNALPTPDSKAYIVLAYIQIAMFICAFISLSLRYWEIRNGLQQSVP